MKKTPLISESVAPWLVLITMILSIGMPLADTTITNVGRVFIVNSLGITSYEAGWITAGYSLALAVGIPLSHRLRGFLEEKRIITVALLGFILGSLFMALSRTFTEAMLSRGLEGLSAGILIPLAPVLIQESFTERLRPLAMSIFALSSAIFVTMGPTIGGFIIDDLGWEWAFGLNVPIGLLAIVFAQAFLTDRPSQEPRRLDGTGFLLLAFSLGLLFTGYMSAEWVGWHSDRIFWFLISGLGVFFLFGFWSMVFPDPILPPEVLKNGFFIAIVIVVFFQATQSFGRLYLLAPFLEKNFHFMAHNAGEVIAVGAITEVLTSLSFLFPRLIAGKWPVLLAAGCLLTALSNLNFLTLPIASGFSLSPIIISQLIFGTGLALFQISLVPATSLVLPPSLMRAATTYLLMSQFLGGCWGTMLGRHLVLHIPPVFFQALPQTSKPKPPLSFDILYSRLAQGFTTNIIFFDLGIIGITAGALALLIAAFFPDGRTQKPFIPKTLTTAPAPAGKREK